MFDIAFSELVVIAIVALLVIGPEKLPNVARTLGALMGRMQKYMTQIKEEVNREARFAELQKLQEEIKLAGSSAQQNLQSGMHQIGQDLQMDEPGLSSTVEKDAPATPINASADSSKE